ncbi:MAG: ion transporter [Planctomycetota bacterium]
MPLLLSMRRWLHLQLDPTVAPPGKLSPVNRVITICIVVGIALFIIETEETVAAQYAHVFGVLDFILGIVFTLEYVARIWAAGERAEFAGVGGRLRYVVRVFSLFDLIAVLPFWLSFGSQSGAIIRMFRLLRIFSLAKFGRYSTAFTYVVEAVRERRYELLVTGMLASAILLLASTVMYFVEGEAQPKAFGSIPRALWWGVATLTTVGYGDVYPITLLGRICAAITAISGIGLIAMPTGILAAAFSDAFQRAKQRREARDG